MTTWESGNERAWAYAAITARACLSSWRYCPLPGLPNVPKNWCVCACRIVVRVLTTSPRLRPSCPGAQTRSKRRCAGGRSSVAGSARWRAACLVPSTSMSSHCPPSRSHSPPGGVPNGERVSRSSRNSVRNASTQGWSSTARYRDRVGGVGRSARPNSAMNSLANGWTRSQNARSVGSPLTAYPMSIAAKSISSYLPIRARTNRTRSFMAPRTPYRWSACATTATSPNQDGVLGESVGSTWMWATGSVIFLSSLSHSFSSQDDTFLSSLPVFQGVLPLFAHSLRIPWVRWVQVSTASAHERASGLTGPGTVTVQATPTEDTTVTTLNKEKLAQEVQQLKNQNEPDLLGWLRTNASILLSTLVVVIGGLIGLFRWLGDRRDEYEKRREDQRNEQEKRAEERFQAAVTGLGDEKKGAKIGAAILLRTFLRPGYEEFYTQTFDLAVAHLRLPTTPDSPEDPTSSLPLTTLSQALIVVFKEAFPLARSQNKGSPQSLDATGIQLDNAYMSKADLRQVWTPRASLRKVDLSEADLIGAELIAASLVGVDLSWSDLSGANLSEAELIEVNLSGADLTWSNLRRANLSRANLNKVKLIWADLSEANLRRADLSEAKLIGAKLSGARLIGANLSGADLSRIKFVGRTQWDQSQ